MSPSLLFVIFMHPLTLAQRQAFIGFAASVVSDTVSNSLRVVKTYRQVHEGSVGYSTSKLILSHLSAAGVMYVEPN